MTTFYVSPSGSDANNGLGPDASHASNKPWLTVGKALGASGISSGDTVYICAGTYREIVSVAMTSPTVETMVIGDVANSRGFKDSSGVLLDSGYVRICGYTTNDTTNPSASTLFTIAGRDFLTFVDIWFQGGGSATFSITTSENLTWRRCVLETSDRGFGCINQTVAVDTATNNTYDSCIIRSWGSNPMSITIPTSTSADYDVNVVFQNCVLISTNTTVIAGIASGANAFKGGGVKAYNCLFMGATAMSFNSANFASSAGNQC